MQVPASLRRRALLHRFGIAIFLALVTFFASLSRRAFAANSDPDPTRENGSTEPLSKWGMAIDLDHCTGCGACVVACRVENNIPSLGPDPQFRGADIYWMNLLPADRPTEGAPELPVDDAALPVPCMHCENPPCVKVCPVGATQLSSEGIVGQISDRCIGCRFCEVACPYGVRFFNWTEPEWDGSLLNALNPDVSTRPRGVVEKCTFCHHRVRRVREEARMDERPITDAELQRLPACASACPADAITFGDLNDSESLVSRLSAGSRAVHLLQHLGTQPKVSYLRRRNYR